jgi:hypothetical protein
MKKSNKLIIFGSILVIMIITILFIMNINWEIKFTDPIVNKILKNDSSLRDQFSQTTIDKYKKSVNEIKSIVSEFKLKWCNIWWDKINLLAEDLRLLKESKQAIWFLKKRLACNNISWETKFDIISALAYISNDIWSKELAIKYYSQIIREFGWNQFPYFWLSEEQLVKQEIDKLKNK